MTLKIAVLVKQVPDLEAIVQVGAGGKLDIENRWVTSFFDEIAVEQALALKKAHPDAAVVALSAGGKRAQEALRRAVAMGIDDVERIGGDGLEAADSLFVAAALAARLAQIAPDIVLAGKQAGDDDLGAVGPMVAELLGIPHVSAVVSFSLDAAARTVTVKREAESGAFTLAARLPALFTAEKGLIEPHLPVVTRVMKAMKAKINEVPLAGLELGIAPAGRLERLGYFPPPKRPPVTMVEDVDALVARLRASGALA